MALAGGASAIAFSHDTSLIAIGEGTEVHVHAIALGPHHAPMGFKHADTAAGAGVGAAAGGSSSGGPSDGTHALPLHMSFVWSESHRGHSACAVFSGDGLLAVGSGSSAHLHEAFSGVQLRTLMHRYEAAPRIIDSRSSVASGSGSDTRAGTVITAIDLSADGSLLATAGLDCRVVLFDVRTGESLREFEGALPVHGIVFSPFEPLLAWGCGEHKGRGDGELCVCDLRSDELIFRVPSAGRPSALRFTALEHTLTTARLLGATDDVQAARHPSPPEPPASSAVPSRARQREGGDRAGDQAKEAGFPSVGIASQLVAAWCTSSGAVRLTWRSSANPAAIAFWASEPPDARALSEALPAQMILYDAAPSGRTLLSSACASRNLAWISGLSASLDPCGVGLLIRDFAGRHALDHSLANRQSKALSLLLKAVARVPPRARTALVHAPPGVPPLLPYLAQQYPKLVADFLNGLGKHGLDEYEPSPSCPALKRAPITALTCDA